MMDQEIDTAPRARVSAATKNYAKALGEFLEAADELKRALLDFGHQCQKAKLVAEDSEDAPG